jgi:DNA-binding IclR family transcriptional regulator
VTRRAAIEFSPYRIQVLERAIALLEVLARQDSDLDLGELTSEAGLHKSTTHRLLRVLEQQRVVERNPASGKYRLGFKLIEFGLAALSRLDMYELARPYLRKLVDETGETAHLAVMRGGDVVSLVNIESSQTVRTPSTVGARSPAHCTSLGKAMLAHASAAQLEDYLRHHPLKPFTRNTITSVHRLKGELRLIRERGYAVDNEEREEGLRCIGAPVWDHSGHVVAAVSIAGPAFRIPQERVPALAASVMHTAASLSAALGYRAASNGHPPGN